MLSERIHRYIYLFGLFGLAYGMLMGTVPTSVPQLILLGNWLVEADFKRKWLQLKSNALFWILSAAFLIHVIGAFYSQDLNAALNDLRTKMPLMFLPVIFFSTKQLSEKEWQGVLLSFIVGCITNTTWCLMYSFVLHHTEVVRNASRFMSHIRLGLYLNVAIVVCIYFCFILKEQRKKIFFVLLVFYFVFVLIALGLASGLVNFVLLFLLAIIYGIYRLKPILKISGFILLVAGFLFVWHYIAEIKDAQLAVNKTENNVMHKVTVAGRPYYHTDIKQTENGNYVLINMQLDELKSAWNKEFPKDSFSFKPQHNLQRFDVLLRYLSSKGLRKDSLGMLQLSDEDKINIQKNIPNYKYNSWSYLHRRTYELVNEYDEFMNGRQVNGHSLTMRLYFWKAATHIIKENYFFGVGTGDVQIELNKTYRSTDSPLIEEWYKRPHNQFLTVTVALGFVGLFVFLFSIFYPAIKLHSYLSIIYWPFFFIAIISFLVEDTLETQAGLTFFAFFQSLFISQAWFACKGEPDRHID